MLSHEESTLDFRALTPSPLTPIPGAAPGEGFEPQGHLCMLSWAAEPPVHTWYRARCGRMPHLTCAQRYFRVSGATQITPSPLGIRDAWPPLVVVGNSFLLSGPDLGMGDISFILNDSHQGTSSKIGRSQPGPKLLTLKVYP